MRGLRASGRTYKDVQSLEIWERIPEAVELCAAKSKIASKKYTIPSAESRPSFLMVNEMSDAVVNSGSGTHLKPMPCLAMIKPRQNTSSSDGGMSTPMDSGLVRC